VLAIGADHWGQQRAFYLLKPLTTVLIALPLVVASPGRDKRDSHVKRTMVWALALCLLGDVLLMFPKGFVAGLAAFLVGHLLFSLSFIRLGGFGAHGVSFLAVFGVGAGLFIWLRPDLGPFLVPVGLYVLVICFMAWQGLGLYLRKGGRAFGWMALGVLLFMLSDTLIAVGKFKAPFPLSGPLVLGTCWASLFLLVQATCRLVTQGQDRP